MNTYGVIESNPSERPDTHHLERLRINGFSIVPEVLTAADVEECRKRLDEVYELQVREFGGDRLSAIKKNDLARSPLSYDPFFLDIALKDSILDIAHGAIGGGYVLLHLQNGIINRPDKKHHQSRWHRDLPYQEFVSSRPLAVGALFCIDEFTKENGCTNVLPF